MNPAEYRRCISVSKISSVGSLATGWFRVATLCSMKNNLITSLQKELINFGSLVTAILPRKTIELPRLNSRFQRLFMTNYATFSNLNEVYRMMKWADNKRNIVSSFTKTQTLNPKP